MVGAVTQPTTATRNASQLAYHTAAKQPYRLLSLPPQPHLLRKLQLPLQAVKHLNQPRNQGSLRRRSFFFFFEGQGGRMQHTDAAMPAPCAQQALLKESIHKRHTLFT